MNALSAVSRLALTLLCCATALVLVALDEVNGALYVAGAACGISATLIGDGVVRWLEDRR